MSFAIPLAILVTCGAAVAGGLWLVLRSKKKSPGEQERERRLAVNAMGRMTDGTLLEALDSKGGSRNPVVVFYRYSVAGVEYSAAQDISGLRHVVRPETCWPGLVATVKYDPQNHSNSIVVCEMWSGLRADASGSAGKPGRSPSLAQS